MSSKTKGRPAADGFYTNCADCGKPNNTYSPRCPDCICLDRQLEADRLGTTNLIREGHLR